MAFMVAMAWLLEESRCLKVGWGLRLTRFSFVGRDLEAKSRATLLHIDIILLDPRGHV